MFKRKPKTRVQKAREDIEKQIRVVNKQAKRTQKEFIKGLNNTANELRDSIEDVFDHEERKKIQQVAHDLDKIAHRVENQVGEGVQEFSDTIEKNPWVTIVVSIFVGMLFGMIVKSMMK